MLLEPYHPFEVSILENIPEGKKSIAINNGKIINFYNPLNFRNVKLDSNGKLLPELPYDIKKIPLENENKYIEETSFAIEDANAWRIHILLCCSFNPPKKWIPGYSYIPMIDNAWLLFQVYSDREFTYKYKLFGDTKNPKDTNIKLDIHNANASFIGTEDLIELQEEEETDRDRYEETINWLGNAANLGVIATLEKAVDTNEWNIKQFLKENYIFTDFFNSSRFPGANTKEFDLNIKTKYKKGPSGALTKKDQRLFDIQFLKNQQKNRALRFFIQPNTAHVKGFFRYYPSQFSHLDLELHMGFQSRYPYLGNHAESLITTISSNSVSLTI